MGDNDEEILGGQSHAADEDDDNFMKDVEVFDDEVEDEEEKGDGQADEEDGEGEDDGEQRNRKGRRGGQNGKKAGRPQGSKKNGSLREKREEQKTLQAAQAKAGTLPKPAKRQRNQVVNGLKYCRACKKWLPAADFPEGSGACGPDKKATTNIRNAALAQGQITWWEEVFADEDKLAEVVKNYHVRVGNSKKKDARSAGVFPCLRYCRERICCNGRFCRT